MRIVERESGEGTYFVPRKSIKIHPQILHVNLSVRRVSNPIHTNQGRRHSLMDKLRNTLDIVDRAQNVGGMGTCHQHSFIRKQFRQIGEKKLGVGRGCRGPPFYG